MATNNLLLSLPPEILVTTMIELHETESLQALVRTCKYLKKIFDENRRSILLAILDDEINIRCGVAIEADACEAAAKARASGKPYFEHSLAEFLDEYRTRRAQQLAPDQMFQKPEQTIFYTGDGRRDYEVRSISREPLGPWPNPASDATYLQRLLDRHMLIRLCVDRFCQEALKNSLSGSVNDQGRSARSQPLSSTELRRLYRAFYRVELYHQVYHDLHEERTYSSRRPAASRMRDFVWLCTFPPHECEELATVYQWLDDGWNNKFKEIDKDLLTWIERQAYVDEGLSVYLETMAEHDSEKLVQISQRCRNKSAYDLIYLGVCLITNSPFHDCNGPMAADDGYPNDGESLHFDRDHTDCPNYGWLWSHRFKMTGEFIHYSHSNLRRIGHVMWDRSRLDTWSIYKKRAPRLRSPDWSETYGTWWEYEPVETDMGPPFDTDGSDEDDADLADVSRLHDTSV